MHHAFVRLSPSSRRLLRAFVVSASALVQQRSYVRRRVRIRASLGDLNNIDLPLIIQLHRVCYCKWRTGTHNAVILLTSCASTIIVEHYLCLLHCQCTLYLMIRCLLCLHPAFPRRLLGLELLSQPLYNYLFISLYITKLPLLCKLTVFHLILIHFISSVMALNRYSRNNIFL